MTRISKRVQQIPKWPINTGAIGTRYGTTMHRLGEIKLGHLIIRFYWKKHGYITDKPKF